MRTEMFINETDVWNLLPRNLGVREVDGQVQKKTRLAGSC